MEKRMVILVLFLIIIPGLLVNRWITAKEKEKQRRGFEVKLTSQQPVQESNEDGA